VARRTQGVDLKISVFTTIGSIGRTINDIQDAWVEAIQNYLQFADEVVVVWGFEKAPAFQLDDRIKVVHSPWPNEFKWEFIGQQFELGYQNCSGDWVIHADLDFFFHEKDFDKIREAFGTYVNSPALSFWKYQFLLADRYRLKSRLVIAVNKKKFGDRIRFNSGGDLCQPSLDGMEIKPDTVPEARIPFYNYDFTFKTKDNIAWEFNRMARARAKNFPNDDWGLGDEKKALEHFKRMQIGRFNNNDGWKVIDITEHPKVLQDKLTKINAKQFGYNMFGWVTERSKYL
jgi:hypothetical protein